MMLIKVRTALLAANKFFIFFWNFFQTLHGLIIILGHMTLNNETVFCQMSLGGKHCLIYSIRCVLTAPPRRESLWFDSLLATAKSLHFVCLLKGSLTVLTTVL